MEFSYSIALNWEGKRKAHFARKVEGSDVSISLTNDNNQGAQRVCIIIRNGLFELIAPLYQRGQVAIDGDKVWFRENEDGIKFADRSNLVKDNKYLIFTPEDITKWEKMVGDYDLCWSEEQELFYVTR